ncbi:hypothetical protein MSAN_00584400 [Mycena sanguinolenta]|uniref:F-box domain-containing protein n=1 Tax=Mycena sanguinolenta TaxID=230812 RepID=A0A8H6Z7H4_9AGAR|nr:hypothetical protein MSAN_00584400 [Mycena sanguinolenta]
MSSPFASRLGTNYCPTDQEVLEIRSLLVQPTLRIKSLDDEIAILQKSIDKLVKERVNLASYVEAHSALISPVRRLPLDVIENIFVACLPTRRNCVMSATEAPILLGRICSAWRTISLTTPRLWASLHIVEPPSAGSTVHTHKMTQRLNNAKTWLGRSGQCPLSISLQCAREDRATTQFIQAVIPFAARWQHIQFTIPPALIFEIMSNIDIDMPCLESIALHCEHFPWMQVKVGSFNMLQGARLSSLSFPANFFAVGRLSLRWNQLTALTIAVPSSGPANCCFAVMTPRYP